MKNTKNNSIVFGLVIMAIIAFGATFIPNEVNAQSALYSRSRTVNARPSLSSVNPNPVSWGSGKLVISVYGANFAPGAVVRINNSDRTTSFVNTEMLKFTLVDSDTLRLGDYVLTVSNPTPGGGVSNSIVFKVVEDINTISEPSTVVKENSTVASRSTSVSKTSNTTKTTEKEETKSEEDENYEDITAAAIFGDGGFFPNSLVGWLILAILVLLLVIIFRKVFKEDKYHQTPLKHA